eukprot:scaffold44093_cov31-Tisochrysis_lutea.AAC.4
MSPRTEVHRIELSRIFHFLPYDAICHYPSYHMHMHYSLRMRGAAGGPKVKDRGLLAVLQSHVWTMGARLQAPLAGPPYAISPHAWHWVGYVLCRSHARSLESHPSSAALRTLPPSVPSTVAPKRAPRGPRRASTLGSPRAGGSPHIAVPLVGGLGAIKGKGTIDN